MSEERLWYEAQQFLSTHRSLPVDRRRYCPDLKRRIWSTVKAVARRRAA